MTADELLFQLPPLIYRDAIRNSGESANALAKKTGVSPPTISAFLNGAEMRTETIDKLAEYFGLKLCREKKTKR